MPGHCPAAPRSAIDAKGREPASAAYRIEHRRGDAATVFRYTDDPLARHRVLAPLAVELVDAGATGVLVLIEQGSGDVLTRRGLHPDGDGGRVGTRISREAPVPQAVTTDVQAIVDLPAVPRAVREMVEHLEAQNVRVVLKPLAIDLRPPGIPVSLGTSDWL